MLLDRLAPIFDQNPFLTLALGVVCCLILSGNIQEDQMQNGFSSLPKSSVISTKQPKEAKYLFVWEAITIKDKPLKGALRADTFDQLLGVAQKLKLRFTKVMRYAIKGDKKNLPHHLGQLNRGLSVSHKVKPKNQAVSLGPSTIEQTTLVKQSLGSVNHPAHFSRKQEDVSPSDLVLRSDNLVSTAQSKLSTPQQDLKGEEASQDVQSQSLVKVPEKQSTTTKSLVSFNFQDIPIKDLLRVIATGRNLNYILSPSIKGNMNLRITDVQWEEAFQTVMDLNNFDYVKYGKVWWIGTQKEVAERKALLLAKSGAPAEKAVKSSAIAKMFHLKYAEASKILGAITKQAKNILSSPGSIEVDERTNSLWVYNTEDNLTKLSKFIESFDKPAKQVLIRVRMITLDSSYNREFGIRLGLTKPTPLFGSVGSAIAPSLEASQTLGLSEELITPEGQFAAVSELPLGGRGQGGRLNFDLPATSLFSDPTSLGLALIKVGSVFLDLELSAMVSEGHAEMIANPSIITANGKAAHLEHGKQVPYPASSSSGSVSVSFQNAGLSLDVTPKIMDDNIIDLEINVNNNSLGEVVPGSNSPAINTQNITSQVFIRGGETVVLGGIYTKNTAQSVARVPFLSDIPLLGRLFRKTHWKVVRKEVIVFITPEIIESTPKPVSYDEKSFKVISDFMEPFKYIEKKSFLNQDMNKSAEDPQDIKITE